jgi:glycosyltransferase involved in cell wall biosynthesis
VFYASARQRRLAALAPQVHALAPRVLYLNSVFSPLAVRLLLLRRVGRLPRGLAVVLAPTGELDPAALEQKRWKKAPYLRLARALDVFSGLIWRAADEREACDVRRVVGPCDMRLAPELPAAVAPAWAPERAPVKQAGRARLVYFSRVTPKKNLLLLLEALQHVHAPIELSIWGPVDDPAYWERCLARVAQLPAHIRVEAHGALPHERVTDTLATFDALALPSLGESFGYAVLEALAAGCPVLVSDRTPWHDLEAHGAGRVLPLERAAWTEALERLAADDETRHQASRAAARRRALELSAAPQAEGDLRALLRAASAIPGDGA